jgi:hypothetical protein
VHGPLREQRQDGRADVAAAGTPATAGPPLAAATPVATATREAAERTAGPWHTGPRPAGRERWEGHAAACFRRVQVLTQVLDARIAEAGAAPPEGMFVSE